MGRQMTERRKLIGCAYVQCRRYWHSTITNLNCGVHATLAVTLVGLVRLRPYGYRPHYQCSSCRRPPDPDVSGTMVRRIESLFLYAVHGRSGGHRFHDLDIQLRLPIYTSYRGLLSRSELVDVAIQLFSVRLAQSRRVSARSVRVRDDFTVRGDSDLLVVLICVPHTDLDFDLCARGAILPDHSEPSH